MGAAFVGRKYFVWADARKPAKNKTERREIEEARNLQRSRQDLIFPQLGRVTFRYFQHVLEDKEAHHSSLIVSKIDAVDLPDGQIVTCTIFFVYVVLSSEALQKIRICIIIYYIYNYKSNPLAPIKEKTGSINNIYIHILSMYMIVIMYIYIL